MNNIQIVTDELTGIEHIIIVNKDNSQITMPKSTYDEMIAAQSTPSVE